jgi:hypothetical protein
MTKCVEKTWRNKTIFGVWLTNTSANSTLFAAVFDGRDWPRQTWRL